MRRPKDFLELLPKPGCDNCCDFEAAVECLICEEFYCQNCWNDVHFGGKRADHQFRALYDYYGLRVDYGEGEFPSKWPSDIQQDDVRGWLLRVHPLREPERVFESSSQNNPQQSSNQWEQYLDEETNIYFYFNRNTSESTYTKPLECYKPTPDCQPYELREGGWVKYWDEETSRFFWYSDLLGQSYLEEEEESSQPTTSNQGENNQQETLWTVNDDIQEIGTPHPSSSHPQTTGGYSSPEEFYGQSPNTYYSTSQSFSQINEDGGSIDYV